MYKIVFEHQALKDLEKLKNAGIAAKAKTLVDIIRVNPFQNSSGYEKLVGKLDGIYSRRINIQHRLVYQVFDGNFKENSTNYNGVVKIIRMWTQYEKL